MLLALVAAIAGFGMLFLGEALSAFYTDAGKAFAAMSLSLLKMARQASLVGEAMLPSRWLQWRCWPEPFAYGPQGPFSRWGAAGRP